ncbi:MAG: tRNA 2-thiouridine(34) synthase MnmA [Candidatus Pelagibacterales bacterium]
MRSTTLDINNKKPTVVAMSGGVDSSVAAALMKRENDNVIGVTLRLYDEKKISKSKSCCSGVDIIDAKKIANDITIPHYVLDYEEIFKKNVIEPFIKDYEKGRTPIPCINCNEKVKFLDLIEFAKSLNAKSLVTGHYIKKIKIENEWRLYIPEDTDRDQSYFLFNTKKKDLDFLNFPLGFHKKDEIRNIAKDLDFHLYNKKDSQDICFVPDGNYKNFIKSSVKNSSGEIVDTEGRVLNSHEGIHNFTVGQRRGLGISKKNPLYVKEIVAETNRVIVAEKESIKSSIIAVNRLNLLTDISKLDILVRVRSNGSLLKSEIELQSNNKAVVNLSKPESSISPGQACVFYAKDEYGTRLLGGGWIHSTN